MKDKGGTIIAKGNGYSAGIGSGSGSSDDASCGNITINKGTVTAYGGGGYGEEERRDDDGRGDAARQSRHAVLPDQVRE